MSLTPENSSASWPSFGERFTANIRDVVLRLKKRGLIQARKDTADKRLSLLGLTRAGLSLFAIVRRLQIESTAKTLSPLSKTERTLLIDLLRRVGDG